MKEHKELKISFDVINNQVKNAKLDGAKEDLVAVMCWGGQDFFDAGINAMLRFYLEQPSREAFLAKFFATISQLDEEAFKQMNNNKMQS